jgi:hypothetical protein
MDIDTLIYLVVLIVGILASVFQKKKQPERRTIEFPEVFPTDYNDSEKYAKIKEEENRINEEKFRIEKKIRDRKRIEAEEQEKQIKEKAKESEFNYEQELYTDEEVHKHFVDFIAASEIKGEKQMQKEYVDKSLDLRKAIIYQSILEHKYF